MFVHTEVSACASVVAHCAHYTVHTVLQVLLLQLVALVEYIKLCEHFSCYRPALLA